ncbi:alpha/beta hydrolase family protein [Niallia endozanthoxylica]|uniref:Alpha/beta hydrolase n=1 Tax=Niallia endozanthoxylica TaxID=2036016 RepID=A0A5J5I7C6_9BACI|nr:alpha/beta hydrolase [Niallia endozanthoxylica]KAA9031606.1 alpha/beta hydrolase [Niallia endozanthoxylica]
MGENEYVTIESQFTLKGTLTVPTDFKEKYPAILIIPGTGMTNRDGNDKGITLNLYKDLTDFLTSLGFITLRYDKRGTHESAGDYYTAGVNDLIDDAAACVRFLKRDHRVDTHSIVILGHSEGALLAPAVHDREPVAGLILLAGAAEPSKDLLPKQFAMAMKEIRETKGFKGWLFKILNVAKKAQKQQDTVMAKILNSTEDTLKIKGTKVNAKWMREQFDYNVCTYLQKATCPTLAISGEKDIQSPPEHAEKIAGMVKGEAEWYMIDNMNHILRKYPKEHKMLTLMKEYKSMFDQPMDAELLERVEKWLKEKFPV